MPRLTQNQPYLNGLSQGLQDNHLLKILFWNAGGLTNDKFSEIKKLIIDNDIDIWGIVEAGAASDNPQYYQLPGYQVYSLKRARQVACGIMIGAKQNLVVKYKVHKEMNEDDKLESVELGVWKDRVHRRLLVAYNPPNNRPDLNWLEATWDSNLILYGDFNAHSTRWGYAETDTVGHIMEEFIDANTAIFVDNNTRSPTFMSYAGYTSHPDIILIHPHINNIGVHHTLKPPPGGFGHKILLLTLTAPRKGNFQRCKTHFKDMWNLKKAKWESYSNLTDIKVTKDLADGKVDVAGDKIKSAIIQCALETVPRGRMKRYSPFWNETLQNLKDARDDAREIAERTGNLEDRITLKQKSAQLKKAIISSKKSTYRSFIQKLDFRNDGIKTHQFISTLDNRVAFKSNPMKNGNKELTSHEDIAKFLCKHFAKISNYHPASEKPNVKPPAICMNKEEDILFNSYFDMSELENALRDTSKGKSAGPDGILPEFLIYLGPKAKLTVLKFLNNIWESHYPSEWRKAIIVPVLKKDKAAELPESFRPIALTSVFSKLYERMILKRLTTYVQNSQLLSDSQAGFRAHRSTVEQVARFSQEVKDGFQRKQSSLAVLIDFKTAFDKVWRRKLISKLINFGISGSMLQAISSFLAQRFIGVKYGDAVSSYKQTRQGLPQGSVLSPLLFNIMIDDVVSAIEGIPGTNALLYADDLIIWATSSDMKALEECMNRALEVLAQWAADNEMEVNTAKTEFQLFTLSTRHQEVSLYYKGNELSRTNSATYLGIRLDPKLQWKGHIQKLIDRAEKRLNVLKRLTGTKWGTTQDVLTLTYTSYVRPSMEYGSELLTTASETSLKKLELMQNKALRLITGAPRSTPIAAMELQTGIDPFKLRMDAAALILHERTQRLHINYWRDYCPASQRLKTHSNFTTKVREIRECYDLPVMERQSFLKAGALKRYVAKIRLRLSQEVKKDTTPNHELRSVALETIHSWYPQPTWLHVYTDGSAKNANCDSGAGVFSSEFQLAEPVGKLASNFDGEIKAILLALRVLSTRRDEKVVILVDSQAAIVSMSSPNSRECPWIEECHNK